MTEGIRYLATDIAAATLLAGHGEDSWRDTLTGAMSTCGCYETADGRWIAVGALDPKFIATLATALDWPELTGLTASGTGRSCSAIRRSGYGVPGSCLCRA